MNIFHQITNTDFIRDFLKILCCTGFRKSQSINRTFEYLAIETIARLLVTELFLQQIELVILATLTSLLKDEYSIFVLN